MIVQTAVTALLGVLSLALSAIPDGSLPAAAAGYLSSFASTIGGALGGLDAVLPITEAAIFVGWILGTYVPIVVTYRITHWVYVHLPVIGNGG